MSDILLATKTHIPPLHGNLISRPHLIQRLNDGIVQNRRLTLISAPAGYGKSTILSEWVSQVNIPAAWLSLEKAENAPVRFWSYLCTALSTIPHLCQSGTSEVIFQALQSPKPPPMEVLLTNLLNDLARLEGRAILVLDDLHAITKSQIHQDLVFLIEHLPHSASGLHLVVASRTDPPWPLARWRVREELNELRPVDLRFSHDEITQFMNRFLQIRLSLHDIAALRERTEGWIAGLQMAAVSMQGRLKAQGPDGVSRFIENFTGSNRFILDYLMEEVVSQQPVDISEFLEQTSILEQFNASLCDAIMDRHDSQAILNQIEQANLFLIPLDDEQQWYRYHHLFAELLHKRLKETRPGQITQLHQRACRWFADNNFLPEAINHALEAEDFSLVNQLVSVNALATVERGKLLDVLRRFEALADQEIASRPWLGVSYAWVKVFVNPAGDVEHILEQIRLGLPGIENSIERHRIESHMDAIRAYVAWLKGDVDQVLELIHHAMENLPENDWPTRATLFNIKGLAYQSLYNLPAATQSYEAAIKAGQNNKGFSDYFIYSNLASVRFLQGRLHQTLSDCQQLLSLVNESGRASESTPALASTYLIMSMVQLEFNNLESAALLARQGVALAEQWKQADTLHSALSCLANTLSAAGNLEEATTIVQRMKQLAHQVSPLYLRYSALDEIRLNLIKGDISAAAQRFAEIEPLATHENKKGWFLLTRAYLLFAQERFAEVILTLDEPVRDLEQKGLYWYLMKLMPVYALALQAMGKEREALNTIRACLDFAASEGFVRIFVERSTPMARLLQIAWNQGIHTGYIQRLLPAFDISDGWQKPTPPAFPGSLAKGEKLHLLEPLSERELQILRLLDSPLTSEEISRELYVSVSTTRTHIRNIYGKLGVHGRIEALQKAKELGLM